MISKWISIRIDSGIPVFRAVFNGIPVINLIMQFIFIFISLSSGVSNGNTNLSTIYAGIKNYNEFFRYTGIPGCLLNGIPRTTYAFYFYDNIFFLFISGGFQRQINFLYPKYRYKRYKGFFWYTGITVFFWIGISKSPADIPVYRRNPYSLRAGIRSGILKSVFAVQIAFIKANNCHDIHDTQLNSSHRYHDPVGPTGNPNEELSWFGSAKLVICFLAKQNFVNKYFWKVWEKKSFQMGRTKYHKRNFVHLCTMKYRKKHEFRKKKLLRKLWFPESRGL